MKTRTPSFTPAHWRAPFLLAALLLAFGLFAGVARAATFTVSKTADTNDGTCNADCSLREAAAAANGTGSLTASHGECDGQWQGAGHRRLEQLWQFGECRVI